MNIRSLYIADFSGARRRTVDLCDGFNIIEGPNESGKSTIAAFIKFMFYGFSDKAERNRYYSFGSSSASGSMTLTHEGREYRIEREYTEGGREKVAIIDTASGAVCFNGRSPADVFLGVPADIFSHTAYVGQTAGSSVDGVRVSRAIENILFSADESVNTDRSLKKLDEARVLLYHKSHKGGRIYDLINERDALRVRLENAKQSNAQLIANEGSLRESAEGLADARLKLQKSKQALDSVESAKRRRGLEKLAELEAKVCAADKKYSDILARAGHDGFLPDDAFAARLAELSGELDRLDRQIDAIAEERKLHDSKTGDLASVASFGEKLEELGGEEEVSVRLDRLDAKKSRSGGFMVFGIIFTLLFAACTAAAYFLDLTEIHEIFARLPERPMPVVIAGSATAFMLLVSIISLICRCQARMGENEILADLDADNRAELIKKLASYNFDETRLRLHQSRTAEFSERIRVLEQQKKGLRDEADVLLERWGRTDLSDAANEASELISALAETSGERDKFVLARDTLAAQLGVFDLSAALLQLTESEPVEELSEEAVERIRREYDFYQKQIEALESRRHRLETELAVLQATVEPPTELADRLFVLSGEIDSLSKKHRALVLAHTALSEAASSLRESVAPRLSRTAGELMNSLTDGRYDRIGVGRALEMTYEAEAQSRGIEFMSAGTRDVAYLSLRFALSELLFGEKRPPMIFDESFSRLDDGRYARVLELINNVCSRGSQIILFTSQQRDARLAAERVPGCNIISL